MDRMGNNQNVVGVSGKCGKRNGCSRISGVDSMISIFCIRFSNTFGSNDSCQRLTNALRSVIQRFSFVFGLAFCEPLSGYPPGVRHVSLMFLFHIFIKNRCCPDEDGKR
jgi:hypothetical protein